MYFNIGYLMEKFRHWFPKAKAAELEAKVKKQNLNPLPASQITIIKEKINQLPIPSPYLVTVQSKLSEMIIKWRQEENAPNSLVVLASPFEPLDKIIKAISTSLDKQNIVNIKYLSWSHRPSNYSSIQSQLLQEIGLLENKQVNLMVIPDLSWCFLRCVDGLDAIEYIQRLLFKDCSRFWLIGCNILTWEYLNTVCQFSGYFQETIFLPDLKGKDLKEWLDPVTESISCHFDQDEKNDFVLENENKSEESYFKHLADISLGLSAVAGRLWLSSLGTKESEDTIFIEKAILPDLPDLTKDDRYLLFSLFLHEKMTVSQLAISLGERQAKVQNQVQLLLFSGILERNNLMLQLNPIHYPQLKRDLTQNHFFHGST